MSKHRDYEVGKGKPPKAFQFKKGQSGNPKGRPKRQSVEDLRLLIDEILAEPVTMREGGKLRAVSNLEAMMHAQLNNGLKGNEKAILTLVNLARKAGLVTKVSRYEDCSGVMHVPLEGDEGKITRLFRAEQAARKNRSPQD
jgi:uncharacterized protein DUF5681